MILHLYSALVRNIWSAQSSAGLPSTRDTGILERVHHRGMNMTAASVI